LVQALKEIELV